MPPAPRPGQRKSNAAPTQQIPPRSMPPSSSPPEVVDPTWLLKAIGTVIALGAVCAYITVCVRFYRQQWQFVLHPTRMVASTPAAQGLAFQTVHFGVDAAGQPEITGWWVPGDLATEPTVLLLHGQDGSLGDTVGAIRTLHDAHLNVLAFDYRGYGQSAGEHPSEASMRRDAQDAYHYLTQARSLAPPSVLIYGAGLGASLAVRLCTEHPEIPAVILQSADGDTKSRELRDARTHLVPMGLLFHERFPLADPLSTLRTPKLFLSYTAGSAPVDAQRAADPKLTAELPPGSPTTATASVIRRFLDTYLLQPPAVLQPAP